MYIAAGSGGAATIERPNIPETEYGGSGPPGGNGRSNGGSGGDNGDNNNEDFGDEGPNLKPMAVEEKFML